MADTEITFEYGIHRKSRDFKGIDYMYIYIYIYRSLYALLFISSFIYLNQATISIK